MLGLGKRKLPSSNSDSEREMPILTAQQRSVRPGLSDSQEFAWQAEIRAAVRTAADLCQQLQLPSEYIAWAAAGAAEFPVFVPPSYLARIEPGTVHDPLLRQVLPLAGEGHAASGFTADPVGDRAARLSPGVLQKYAGRALLIATGACAIHCRYCFRRHYPYEEAPHSLAAWDVALGEIGADSSIEEIILSGGDPLMLVDARLQELVERITAIPHVTRLRIHTRLPVVVPSRITEALLRILTESRLTAVVVLHVNHPQELARDVVEAIARLRTTEATLLNQAVLLRGVNDSVATQRQLSERLIDLGVVPYYLHQLDRVAGAAHFEVPTDEGQRIIEELRRQLPGYMVPRYVQEIPGEPSKSILI